MRFQAVSNPWIDVHFLNGRPLQIDKDDLRARPCDIQENSSQMTAITGKRAESMTTWHWIYIIYVYVYNYA